MHGSDRTVGARPIPLRHVVQRAELVGVGLVLYRQMPKVKRYLAYLPEGPVINWDAIDLGVPFSVEFADLGA
jgi:hypothetical protein